MCIRDSDFNNRYRIGTKTADNDSSNDDGDLFFDTGANKMYVYDGAYGSGGSWKEVTSAGDFKFLTIKDHDQAAGGSGPTFNGSNEEFDLFDSSADASINSAAQLIVVLNGVVQKPNSGTFSGSEEGFYLNDTHGIKFCDPPPSGSTLFVTQIGTAVALNEPADDTVSEAKIQVGAVSHTRLAADCVDGDNIQDDVINSEHIAAGAVDLEHMSSESVDEDNLHISNAGSNGQFLSKQSGNSGGLTWATPTDTNTNILSGGTIAGDVVFDNATHSGFDITWDESDKALEFADNTKATFGAGGDLEIFHEGTYSVVRNSEGGFYIQTDDTTNGISLGGTSGGETMAKFIKDGGCELNHNNEKRLETKAVGVFITSDSDSLETLQVGNSGSSFNGAVIQSYATRNTTNESYMLFKGSISGIADKFKVYDSGDVDNTNNAYGSLSDVNLKENIVDASSQWNDIKNIRVRKFNFKDTIDPSKPTLLGVIAQEAELVCPNLVKTSKSLQAGEEKDYKTFKYSVLYMKAIKALQEAMARIETLETKVAELEAG